MATPRVVGRQLVCSRRYYTASYSREKMIGSWLSAFKAYAMGYGAVALPRDMFFLAATGQNK
jgi:hypothetical protein